MLSMQIAVSRADISKSVIVKKWNSPTESNQGTDN